MAEQSMFIVGAGPGLSAALARRFAREGYRVGLIARSEAALREVAAGVGHDTGTQPVIHAADASDPAALRAAWEALSAEIGEPSVAIYNAAGMRPFGPPTIIDPDAFSQALAISITGALVTAQLAAPAMREAGRGTILITGGGLALHPSAGAAVLSAGKAAVRSLAFTLAEELAPEGIHVATVTIAGLIAPGTPFDPDRIADVYWGIHAELPGAWTTERQYGG